MIRSAHASFSMTSLISSASNSGCAQKDAALEVKNFQELAERMKVLGKSVYALTNWERHLLIDFGLGVDALSSRRKLQKLNFKLQMCGVKSWLESSENITWKKSLCEYGSPTSTTISIFTYFIRNMTISETVKHIQAN